MNENKGYEIGWDDQIENDSPDFILLPEGDYDFEVIEFERGRHPGSEKLPPCNKAVVHIKITTPEGVSIIKRNLFLHSITEGMLCAFFTSIGQRKRHEKVSMNWNTVVGSTGRCKIIIKEIIKNDGEKLEINDIKKFYEPTENKQSSTQPQQQKFEPGKF